MGSVVAALGAMGILVLQATSENELRIKTEATLATITGGDSFSYLSPMLSDGTTNQPYFLVVHQGKYPLYDVVMRVVDLEKSPVVGKDVAPEELTPERITQSDTILNVGNLPPATARFLQRWQLPPDSDRQSYNVFITSRNGWTTQNLRFRRVNGHWTFAIRVFRDSDRGMVVLYEKILKDFPRDNNGHIQW